MQSEEHAPSNDSIQAITQQNASTPNRSPSNVETFANPNSAKHHHNEEEGKSNDNFFNHYTSQDRIETPVSPQLSSYSDSVSRIGDDNNRERNLTRTGNSSYLANTYQQSHVLPPVWCSQMQR